jgi:hypothetical protein
MPNEPASPLVLRRSCPKCSRVLEFSGDPPMFCAYCGNALSTVHDASTIAADPPGQDTAPHFTGGATAEAPERIAGYRLLRPLGQGGMGTVFEAEDERFGRHVALKLVTPGSLNSPEALDRFRQEGRLAGTIAHPRCVFVLGADEAEGRPYIVMELMPGTTLQDVVRQKGALSPRDAVAKILDVIDGLCEAHRIGVIHRDVKPSNCFVDTDGRIKIGDFGLSKSLATSAHLTRTGSFLGTPLYASPEQIRSDALDARTDVYSVAATLYYLLIGQAPFESSDATATMARIISDPPPRLRTQRPEVPRSLERIVLKGLERNRERRWRNLDELRAALAPFVEDWGTARGLGLRFAAYCLDFALLTVPSTLVATALAVWVTRNQDFLHLTSALLWFVYFWLMDAFLGGTVGKWALGIGVRQAETGTYAGVGRGLLRTGIFFLPVLVLPPALHVLGKAIGFSTTYLELVGSRVLGVVIWPLLLFVPARPANGYRGLHEVYSGTRVVKRLRGLLGRPAATKERPVRQSQVVKPKGVPPILGSYTIEGAMLWDARRKILLGHDPSLGRPVWIVMRDRTAPELPGARLELSRPSRQRWLSGGEAATQRWDAFAATEGCLLADLIVAEGTRSGAELIQGRRGLPWVDARPLLEQLAEELDAACRDGTLPQDLTPDHVWIPRHGHVQLLDTPMGGLDTTVRPPAPASQDVVRAMALLREVAIVVLEGGRRPASSPPKPIRAPVPVHARRMLDRLLGLDGAYEGLTPFLQDMAETRESTPELAPALRLVHAGLFVVEALTKLGLATGLIALLEWLFPSRSWTLGTWGLGMVLAIGWPFLAAFTRGGLVPRILGMALVRSDGASVSPARLALRELAFWLPVTLIVLTHQVLEARGLSSKGLTIAIVATLVLLAIAYAAHGLLRQGQLLQDRIAGTQVVPE